MSKTVGYEAKQELSDKDLLSDDKNKKKGGAEAPEEIKEEEPE